MQRISLDKRIVETIIQHLTSQRTNIYCDVVTLINMIEQDAKPIEEPKEEDTSQA